jgi:hypothetical protein
MDGAGEGLLSRAGFALNQDRTTGWGNNLDLFQHRFKNGAVTDDLFKAVQRNIATSMPRSAVAGQFPAGSRPEDLYSQMVW